LILRKQHFDRNGFLPLRCRCCCDFLQVGDRQGAAALARLTGLQQLDLSCSGLGNAGLLALAPLAVLQELNLDMCRVGDEGCRVSVV
jgi:hypothetical protein